ncbi:hypothetical protein K438DRAFT_1984765 [Mycena galopus ATCC 62051]|nr:hypothetical protein K438DRAFT_1984765 [Mycena galopus ATCC 62051]
MFWSLYLCTAHLHLRLFTASTSALQLLRGASLGLSNCDYDWDEAANIEASLRLLQHLRDLAPTAPPPICAYNAAHYHQFGPPHIVQLQLLRCACTPPFSTALSLFLADLAPARSCTLVDAD